MPADRSADLAALDATIALASKGGFDAVQMRAVAERADVALGTLYRYFPSKIHLLVSALGREFERANAGTAERFSASAAYHRLVRHRLAELAEAPLPGLPTLSRFLERRLDPAMATVAATGTRIASPSLRAARLVDLLRALQAKHSLAYLFISHDLRVVRAMAHRIVVMKDGVVVEEGDAEALTAAPREPYTRALMAAAFDLKAERVP